MSVADNLQKVQQQVEQACRECGRDPQRVRLIAVSKRQPSDKIRAAYAAGQRDFGENYGQELRDKAAELLVEAPDIRWHFIGPIQSNKVRYIAPVARWVHTIARADIAAKIFKRAQENSSSPKTLLEVNIAREQQKAGISPDDVEPTLQQLQQQNLSPQGLMCMPPFSAPLEETAAYFRQLRLLAQEMIQKKLLPDAVELSMGMSEDFPQAIAEGATMVRVGTAIFGQRG